MTLAEFIAARLDEVTAFAEAAARCRGKYEWCPEPQVISDGLNLPDAQFIRYWEPARVLRQVMAMRAILEQCKHTLSYKPPVPRGKSGEWALARLVAEHMAEMWSDHPDYSRDLP